MADCWAGGHKTCDWITWEWSNIGGSASIHICSQFQNWIHWLTNWKADHYREWEPTGKKVPTTICFYQLASYIKQSNLATGYLNIMHINADNSIAHLCRLCHRLYKDSPQKTKSSLILIKTNGNPSVKMAKCGHLRNCFFGTFVSLQLWVLLLNSNSENNDD